MYAITRALLALSLIAAVSRPLGAQAPGRPVWVKPGLRITHYAAAATVPGSRSQLVPNSKGEWVDAAGRRYGEKDIPGPAGHGFTEVTVAYIDDRVAVLDIRSLGMNPSNGNSLSVLRYAEVVGTPENTEFWIHPARLAALTDSPGTGRRVYQMPYELNGRRFSALRINTVGDGATSAVYDRDSGLLIFTTSSAQGSSVITPQGDRAAVGAGSTVLAQSRLLAVRETAFPWNERPLPQWFSQVRTIDIQGRVTTDVHNAGSVVLGMAGRIEFRGGGTNWRRWLITTQITQTGGLPQIPNTLQRVSGNSSVGGLALNPGALAGLSAGRLLDQDQVTGIRTSVAHANPQSVVIAEQGHGLSVQYHYEPRTGMLMRAVSQVTIPTGRETVEYHLVNPR